MQYFKVKPQYDQTRVNNSNDFLIKNELKTERDLNKLHIKNNSTMFDVIEIPKNKTFFLFGARFSNFNNNILDMKPTKQIKNRLEYLRNELRNERISYAELSELESLAKYIDKNDVELLEAAGVTE